MDELNILREQLGALKKSLDQSQIVNRRLMITVMKQKSSWLDRLVKSELIIVPVSFLIILAVSQSLGITPWLAISFFILAAIDTVIDFRTVRISANDFSDDMVSLRRKLIVQKRRRFQQLAVSTPLSLIWMCWFLAEMVLPHHSAKDLLDTSGPLFWVLLVEIIVCCALTIGIIVYIYRKMQRTNNELIRSIDEYQSSDSL